MDKTSDQLQEDDEGMLLEETTSASSISLDGRPPPFLPLKRVWAHRLLGGPFEERTGELREGNWILFRYIKGCLVLLTRRLSAKRAAEAAAILSDPNTYGDRGRAARCFSPGLGFTFGTGDSAVHVQVCLKCLWVFFYTSSGSQSFVPSPEGLRKLKALYERIFPFYVLKLGKWMFFLLHRWLGPRR